MQNLKICCLLIQGASQDSPQQNISLTWVDGMFPEICLFPPPENSVQNYDYKICILTKEHPTERTVYIPPKEYCTSRKTIMGGGFVQFFTNTSCDQRKDKQPVINYNDKDLVKTWECVIRSSSLTHCSWEPAPDAPDLRFFYILACEGSTCHGILVSPIQECPLYTYTGERRTGCNLKMKPNESIHFLLNGTVGKKTVRNTFRNSTLRVQLPPLNWTVNKTENKFNISWTPPDVFKLSAWNFMINYTRCGQPPITKDSKETYWTLLDREPSCQYRISIKAESARGGTLWSEKTFDADANLTLIAAIIIPLVLAIMVVVTLVCFQKNKENILPKVPVPRDLLSDISENNNKITVGNLYSPAKEEEDCKITLVIDPKINIVGI